MKKILMIALLALTASVLCADGFLGIAYKTPRESVLSQMAAKGYTLVDEVDTRSSTFSGEFSGDDVSVIVAFEDGVLVSGIIMYFGSGSASVYRKHNEQLAKKYGEGANTNIFERGWKVSDGVIYSYYTIGEATLLYIEWEYANGLAILREENKRDDY